MEASSLDGPQASSKAPRHPRWTRQETMVLIEGKKIADERGRRGRRSNSALGSNNMEPKWDAVTSYCRRHGVSRGPVQCRKRWSNLLSDFKKIKTWDSQVRRERETFWTMRSDLRRERRLPGFFDRDIYDVLDGKTSNNCDYQLVLVPTIADKNNTDGLDELEVEDEEEMVEDEEAGESLLSEFGYVCPEEDRSSPSPSREQEKVHTDAKRKKIPAPVPISELRLKQFQQARPEKENKNTASNNVVDSIPHPGSNFWGASQFQERVKRRQHSSTDFENIEMDNLIIRALERNTNLLNAQLEEQRLNCQFEREQREDHHKSLMASLTKISDTLEKIANKCSCSGK